MNEVLVFSIDSLPNLNIFIERFDLGIKHLDFCSLRLSNVFQFLFFLSGNQTALLIETYLALLLLKLLIQSLHLLWQLRFFYEDKLILLLKHFMVFNLAVPVLKLFFENNNLLLEFIDELISLGNLILFVSEDPFQAFFGLRRCIKIML